MVENVSDSWEDVQKMYFPKSYQEELIKRQEYSELTRYLVNNDINLDLDMTSEMESGELGKLMANISMGRVIKMARSSRCLVG